MTYAEGTKVSVAILQGDALDRLQDLADESVDCIVTSPPYFGLRDYGVDGQIGLEETPDAYVAKLVEVFREARRVLRDDGTLWLNLGDSYYGGKGKSGNSKSRRTAGERGYTQSSGTIMHETRVLDMPQEGFKPKDLMGVPWRVAFALQADGWFLRQDIIWHKPNPMPESVRDRCTKAHEYVFLLSKSPKYFFDNEAVKEPATCNRMRGPALHADTVSTNGNGGLSRRTPGETRNKRSVWTISTKPYKGAHFATFPPDLIEPCILAGCPADGVVLDPFAGAGTTGIVARSLKRRATLIELNPEYVQIAEKRLNGPPLERAADCGTPSLFGDETS